MPDGANASSAWQIPALHRYYFRSRIHAIPDRPDGKGLALNRPLYMFGLFASNTTACPAGSSDCS